MPISVWNGSAWKPAKSIPVWNGTDWVRAKKVKVWNGSAWVLSWVHPVENASLSLSKAGVTVGESYDVVLSYPQGYPEGVSVTFWFTGYAHTVYPAEGATEARLSGATHASPGSYQWHADVTTKGGDTSFGPVSQTTADIPSTSVTLTAPTWVLSTSSGSGGSASIASRTFTIDLSNPALVTRLSFQLSYAGGPWTEYAGWDNPPAQVTHTMAFSTAGSWSARAVATQASGLSVYSSDQAVPCYIKHLTMTQSISPVYVGDSPTIRATHSGDALFSSYGRWQYLYAGGAWTDWISTNPTAWNASGETDISFRWVEDFSDGSVIRSNVIRSVVTVRPVTDITLDGGHCHDIEAALAQAAREGRTLRLTGTFWVYTNVDIPSNVYVNATGATFYCNRDLPSTTAYNRPGDAHNPGKFVNLSNGTGGYGHAGWFTWDGGTFDGNGEGCFTISHSPGFTIKNATFYRYCADQAYFSWGDGHAIEVNSSGGPDNASGLNGTFNVLIKDCSFLGTDMGQRSWGNDEPVQYDWSWNGSGGAAPYDSTMTHNMRVTGCTFHRLSEGATASGSGGDLKPWTSWQWRFAICAIGAHNPSGSLRPSERHNHLQFDNNAIHGAAGYGGPDLSFDKGAIHSHAARQVWVVNNAFYGCATGNGGYQVTAQDSTDVTYNATPSGNTSNNGGYPNQWRVANT